MKKFCFLIIILFFIITSFAQNHTDLIIFSYHRPLQLYALLESIEEYVTGINNAYIIYRTDNDNFETGYQEVFSRFSFVTSLKQTINEMHNNFYELMMGILEYSKNDYCLFAVDDMIVKDYFDIKEAIDALEQTESYAFFYRLGLHLSICYPHVKPNEPNSGKQPVPPVEKISENMVSWKFNEGVGDWNYPNNVDMTLYRRKDILDAFNNIPRLENPNKIEEFWSRRYPKNKKGLCYKNSKVINIPMNIVQEVHPNRQMGLFTAEELLNFFNQGLKINIDILYKINNESAHINYVPEFIRR